MAGRWPTAMLHRIHMCVVQHVIRMWIVPGTRDLESMVAQGFVKHGFKVLLHLQGAASLCRRWPFATFTLPGLTNPVRLHPVYPCILGLRVCASACYPFLNADSTLIRDLNFRDINVAFSASGGFPGSAGFLPFCSSSSSSYYYYSYSYDYCCCCHCCYCYYCCHHHHCPYSYGKLGSCFTTMLPLERVTSKPAFEK